MIDFTVKPDGADAYSVTADSRDIVRWEQLGEGRAMQRIVENPSMVSLYELAHIASKRAGYFSGSLDDFVDSCALEFESRDEPGPTQ